MSAGVVGTIAVLMLVILLVTQKNFSPRRPVAPGPPRSLSLIGYWSVPGAPPDQSPGWPDPHDLVGAWSPADRRAIVAHLGRGTVFRHFMGLSACRFCGQVVGSRELTDGRWAWPEGLAHYVEAHDVRLPEAFLEGVRAPHRSAAAFLKSLEPETWVIGGYEAASPIELKERRAWVVDDAEWLDWSAANTPARSATDAATLEEIRAMCARLSHPKWRAEVEEVNGRWRLQTRSGEHRRHWYLHKCSTGVRERRLLRLRLPDERHHLPPEQAIGIATAADGSWGAVRVLAASAGSWLVWCMRPDAAWPTVEEVQDILRRDMRFDQVVFNKNGKFFFIPPPDEPAWRWLLTLEREEREASPPPKVEATPE